jgi:ribonuclease E
MTDSSPSGADGDPSPGALRGSQPGAPLPERIDNPPRSGPSAAVQIDPAPDAGSAQGTPGRRRRRRGGARRRRARERALPAGFEAIDGSGPHGESTTAPERSQFEDAEPESSASVESRESTEARVESDGHDEARRGQRRGRRRRGGRGRNAAPQRASESEAPASTQSEEGRDEEDAPSLELDEPQESTPGGSEGEGGRKKRRRRRRRRGNGGGRPERDGEGARDRGAARPRPAELADGPVAVEVIPGEDDEFAAENEVDAGEEAEEAGGELALEPDDEPAPIRRGGRKNVILVNAADREETRVAVVEGGRIVDFQMTSKRHKSLVNDIYRGRIVNLEPAIGAAFVDFGQGRNGFLHTSDVLSAYGEEDWKLEKLLTTKIDPEEWDADANPPEEEAGASEDGAAAGGEEGAAPREEQREESQKGRERGRRDRRGGRPRARPRLPISDLLEKGDGVVVQVTKDAIGDKGPTLTTYISIPGRYLVLMPSMARTGVSRKIEDEKERRRLKRLLEGLDVPPGMGVIVRTAGTGCTKAELKRDLDYLLLLWESFGKRLTLGRGPAPLYEESDVAIRTIRDLFSDDTEAVLVDDERVHQRVAEFVEKLMPENLSKVKLHQGLRPLFHSFNVEQDFERIFARRIDLPSGGSIVFDQTEALVAIDVNSGKTRSEGFDFEDIALRTNLDAVPEIARQIRLRDLGGIIVIDFIDMQKSSHRRQVERALRDALASDRARSKIGRISQFGLVELTRQRLGPGLSRILFHNCPRCRGSGRLRTVESRSEAIVRRLGSAMTLKGFTKVELRAAPEVIEHLKAEYGQTLKDLEVRHERELELIQAPDQVEDSVLRYLRADGREVRPGGRRKR